MVWVCKQHGKGCRSYVVDICEEFNNKKITPKNLNQFQEESVQQFLVCVKWVDE